MRNRQQRGGYCKNAELSAEKFYNTRFDWLYAKLSNKKIDQNAIIEIIAELNEQWESDQTARQNTFNLVLKV